eukprot:scaffold4147_cov114-Skeletonema_dohrnii-CCMP3373.AAC.4
MCRSSLSATDQVSHAQVWPSQVITSRAQFDMPSKKTKGSRKTARKAVQSAAKVSNRTDAQNDEESKAAEEDSFLEG